MRARLVGLVIATLCGSIFSTVGNAAIVITPVVMQSAPNNINNTVDVTITFNGKFTGGNPTIGVQGTPSANGNLIAGYGFTYDLPSPPAVRTLTAATAQVWTLNSLGTAPQGFNLPLNLPSHVSLAANTVTFAAERSPSAASDEHLWVSTADTTIGTVTFKINLTSAPQTFNLLGQASSLPSISINGFAFYGDGSPTHQPIAIQTFTPAIFTVPAITAVPEPGSLLLLGVVGMVLGVRQTRRLNTAKKLA